MVYQGGVPVAPADARVTGRPRQLKIFPRQDMMTVRLANLVVACLLIGPLNTSAKDCKYRIRTETGTHKNAGTDAAVRIKLYGSEKTCGWRTLNTPANDFEKGKVDYFSITCPCLGCIKSFKVKHNNANSKPGLYLDSVGVRLWKAGTNYQMFPCKKWLQKKSKLERKFYKSRSGYRVRIYTGNVGNIFPAEISLGNGFTSSVFTTLSSLGNFDKYSTLTFYRPFSTKCPVKEVSLRIKAPAGQGNAKWRIKWVYVLDRTANYNYKCSCNNCMITPIARTIACQKM